jgi:hypothetical protein
VVTKREIADAISGAELLDASGNRIPYGPWQRHQSSLNKAAFLVSGDRMKRGSFKYGQFDKVFKYIDRDMCIPLNQVRCIRWGSDASDLRDFLVFINSWMRNYLERILVVSLEKNEQAGWYLGGNASVPGGFPLFHSGHPDPKWSTHLPNLSHVP